MGGGGDLELEPLQKSYTGGLSPCRRFAGGGAKYRNLVWKIEIKYLESNCNVLVGKIFLPKKLSTGGGGGRVRIIPAPLLHSFCSAPPEIESQLRAWVYCKNSLDGTGTIIIIKQSETQTTSLPDISPSGICLKSWLIIIWVWPILFCSTEAPASNCRPVNSPGAAGRLPVLTFFSRSPGIKIFSPGCLF